MGKLPWIIWAGSMKSQRCLLEGNKGTKDGKSYLLIEAERKRVVGRWYTTGFEEWGWGYKPRKADGL